MSPESNYFYNGVTVSHQGASATSMSQTVDEILGIRPVVTLLPSTEISGTGTETDPWIVK